MRESTYVRKARMGFFETPTCLWAPCYLYKRSLNSKPDKGLFQRYVCMYRTGSLNSPSTKTKRLLRNQILWKSPI